MVLTVVTTKCGPIFQQLSRDGKPLVCTTTAVRKLEREFHTVYLNDTDQEVNISYKNLDNLFKKLYQFAGYGSTLSLYSIQKTACKWAARCGGKEWHLKNTGTSVSQFLCIGISFTLFITFYVYK